ncbi:hypothetical protein Plec18167_001755 [Paecilomyces lecythidis]|uniref:Uncharacterized protein n=1 Tax=Paecilomyces lecythidis TaxID=3004212 RepID=A0ABR3Y9V4_9EURO
MSSSRVGPVFAEKATTTTTTTTTNDAVFLPERISAYNTRYCEGLLRGGVIFPGVVYVRRAPSAEEVRVRRALKREKRGEGDIALEVLVWMFGRMRLGGDE